MANLENRKTRVSKLRELALKDRNLHKALQANYILQELNKRILQNSLLQNSYSNLY